MEIRILGPTEAIVDSRAAPLAGAKQRAVLVMLALEAPRAVTAERLVEGLWGEAPPPSAGKMLQVYVSQLRKALTGDGGSPIVTRGRGYELKIAPDALDATASRGSSGTRRVRPSSARRTTWRARRWRCGAAHR